MSNINADISYRKLHCFNINIDIGNCLTLPYQNSIALLCHVIHVHIYIYIYIYVRIAQLIHSVNIFIDCHTG